MTAIMVGGQQFNRVKRGTFRRFIRAGSTVCRELLCRHRVTGLGTWTTTITQVPATGVETGSPTDDELASAVRVLAGKLDLRSLERLMILQTLATVNGSRRAAVERLGISERTLRNKLQQYRLGAVT